MNGQMTHPVPFYALAVQANGMPSHLNHPYPQQHPSPHHPVGPNINNTVFQLNPSPVRYNLQFTPTSAPFVPHNGTINGGFNGVSNGDMQHLGPGIVSAENDRRLLVNQGSNIGHDPSSNLSQNLLQLTSGHLSSPATGAGGGSKLGGFFAQQQQSKFLRTTPLTPVRSTDLQSATPLPVSIPNPSIPLSATTTSSHVPVYQNNTVPHENNTTTVRLHDIATPAAHPVLPKRPNDLLLHIFNGRPIFETTSGDPPNAMQLAYIDAYYEGLKDDHVTLDGPLTEDRLEESDDEAMFSRHNRICERCNKTLPVAVFEMSSRTCRTCQSVLAKPPSAKSPARTIDTTSVQPASSPRKVGRPPKNKPSQDVALPRLPSNDNLQNPKKKHRSGASSSQSSSSSSLRGAARRRSRSPFDPVSAADDIMRAAPLIVLLKRKPDVRTWTPGNVTAFLHCIRGIGDHLSWFLDRRIDGKTLWRMCGMDDDWDAENITLTPEMTAANISQTVALKIIFLLKMIVDEDTVDSDRLLCSL